jgi:hypothetical protein
MTFRFSGLLESWESLNWPDILSDCRLEFFYAVLLKTTKSFFADFFSLLYFEFWAVDLVISYDISNNSLYFVLVEQICKFSEANYHIDKGKEHLKFGCKWSFKKVVSSNLALFNFFSFEINDHTYKILIFVSLWTFTRLPK